MSDRTIRRWKLELERTGRIGKPPESRTGRHRVLTPEVEAVRVKRHRRVLTHLALLTVTMGEQALFEHVKNKADMSVDDILWWLYDTYKIVVGTRTIRRVFERKGNTVKGKGKGSMSAHADVGEDDNDRDDSQNDSMQSHHQYQSPYAPMQTAQSAEQQLVQALQAQAYPALEALDSEIPEDEETIQLQLQQIALQKREVELKLKMRRLQQGRGTPSGRKIGTPKSAPSTLFNPATATTPSGPKRDSRSKKKIEESKKRTAERQERMLRDLERRSRRRDHLTAEWVQSKDIWPLRAQGILADLMHQYNCYAFSQNNIDVFELMYRELYHIVDLSKGDWVPQVHDELLRERMKRKMGQLRTKMQKTGEIVGRADAYGGWQRAENYTGEAAGAAVGDESEMQTDAMNEQALHEQALQAQAGASQMHPDEASQHQQIQYEPVSDHQGMHHHPGMPYGAAAAIMQHPHAPPPSQYPMMPQAHHPNILPYGNMDGMQQQMQNQEGMTL